MMLRRLVTTAIMLTLAILAATSLRAQPGATGQGGRVQGLRGDVSVFNKLDQVLIKDPIGPNPTNDMIRRYGLTNLKANEYGSSVFVSSGSGCTAALIGPRVLLTAAHCSPGVTIELPDGITAVCAKLQSLEPKLARGSNHKDDIALCVTDRNAAGPYETLSFDPTFVAVGEELVLSGYGLTGQKRVAVGDALNLGLATIKRSILDATPSELVAEGAQLAKGDSGGAAFFVPKGSSRRFVVAVNKDLVAETRTSVLTPLAGLHIRMLMEKWQATAQKGHGIQLDVCGLNGFSTGCRDK